MGSRLFVGNLPYSCTEEEVRGLFEPRWPVAEARIVTDRETGRSRGFAFVELESPEAAQEAIADLDSRQFGGRPLAIREAHERQGGNPRRPRSPERSAPSVDTVMRRSSPSFREPSREAAPQADNGRRWGPPRDQSTLEVPASFDDGGKDRRRERRKKKRERHEPDW